MPLTPAERSANARRAALQRSATEDTRAMNDTARRAFRDSFVPDDPALTEAERQRRGEAAYRAHMLRLSQLSAAARRARREQLQQARDNARQVADTLAQLADGQV